MNVIHIGLAKAASTTLQNRLLSQQNTFAYAGKINNAYTDPLVEQLIRRICFCDSLEYDTEVVNTLMASVRERLMAQSRPMLISSEALSAEGLADRRLIAERLHRLFAPARILIVLRAQQTRLQSLYLNYLRGSGLSFISFQDWLDRTYGDIHARGLNYEPLVRLYEELFGRDNVVVVPFEWIRDHLSMFSSRVASLLQMEPSAIQTKLAQNVDNRRMSERHLVALRFQNYLPHGTNLALVGRRHLPPSIYESIRRFVIQGQLVSDPEIPEGWSDRIFELCARGNAQIEARYNISLRSLGYPVQMS